MILDLQDPSITRVVSDTFTITPDQVNGCPVFSLAFHFFSVDLGGTCAALKTISLYIDPSVLLHDINLLLECGEFTLQGDTRGNRIALPMWQYFKGVGINGIEGSPSAKRPDLNIRLQPGAYTCIMNLGKVEGLKGPFSFCVDCEIKTREVVRR